MKTHACRGEALDGCEVEVDASLDHRRYGLCLWLDRHGWTISVPFDSGYATTYANVTFCPWCGERLP